MRLVAALSSSTSFYIIAAQGDFKECLNERNESMDERTKGISEEMQHR